MIYIKSELYFELFRLRRNPLSLHWISLAHPFRKPSLEGENLGIPKANCHDRGLHARVSPGAPAIKHESRVLFRRKNELKGRELFFRDKD